MKIFVAVNRVNEIGYRQTTALLIAAFVRLGHAVSLADAEDFSVETSFEQDTSKGPSGTHFSVNCKTLPTTADCNSEVVEDFAKAESASLSEPIEPGDMIVIRTNPGRDAGRACVHDSFLDLCQAAQAKGIRVSNDPSFLKYFASKASLAAIDPKFCPPLIVSNKSDLIADFVRRSGTDCIIKPLVGSRGQNVIRVNHSADGLESLIETTFKSNGIVAQHFVEADHPGDKRVVVSHGKLLDIDGHLAGIERRPAEGDFRANLHAGGTAHPLKLSDTAREAAEYAADLLFNRGISLAGIDLIGDKIIEFNVFSTGGLFDAESYSGINFSDVIAKQICG